MYPLFLHTVLVSSEGFQSRFPSALLSLRALEDAAASHRARGPAGQWLVTVLTERLDTRGICFSVWLTFSQCYNVPLSFNILGAKQDVGDGNNRPRGPRAEQTRGGKMPRMVPAVLRQGAGGLVRVVGPSEHCGGYVCTCNPACSSAQERVRCTFVANIFWSCSSLPAETRASESPSS